ncbi:hypothetical protein PROFUN_01848 [Planoprotostelium fungivorum]|uniref:NAD(P)-binding domain-containing protein n=1 Tax=Planoprotostelium fungivorum TaxID=1890364 RepID=A0A2P6NYY1_9EUKA|nr:hypothetical protein PROFUN_01848 [Planoprotostelium fungivorum]
MTNINDRPLIFLIGSTGFVGGSVFGHLYNLKSYRFILLVRSKEKAEKLSKMEGIEAIVGSFDDVNLITDAAHRADLVIEAASSDTLEEAKAIVAGLKKRYDERQKPSLYIQTSGSQILDEDVRGTRPSDYIYQDEDNDKLNSLPVTQPHRHVDTFLIEESQKNYFKLVLMCPPTIYGEGLGPKDISAVRSQQVPTMIRAALKHRQAQQVGQGLSVWSNVNVSDLVLLYQVIVEKLLHGQEIPINREGYYFATTGVHTWNQLARAIAARLKALGAVDSEEIRDNNDEDSVEKAFGDKKAVGYLGSNSRSNGTKGEKIGWQKNPASQGLWDYVDWECERMAREAKETK